MCEDCNCKNWIHSVTLTVTSRSFSDRMLSNGPDFFRSDSVQLDALGWVIFITQPKITQELTELTGFVEACWPWGESRPPAYSTSASWQPTNPSRTTPHWRPGGWWSGSGVFA